MNKLSKSEQTKEKILSVAQNIFSQKGFHNTTTSEIAKEAGIAEGTIFRYFKTKKFLLITSLAPIILKVTDNILRNSQKMEPEEFLANFFKNRITIFKKVFPIMKIILFEGEVDSNTKQKWTKDIFLNIASKLEKAIDLYIQLGKLRKVDSKKTAKILLSIILGSLMFNELSNGEFYDDDGIDGVIPEMTDIFINGIKNK